MIRIFLVSSLLTLGLSEFQLCQAETEVNWKPIDIPKAQPFPVIWDTTNSDSVKRGQPPTKWEAVPEAKDQNQPSSGDLGGDSE